MPRPYTISYKKCVRAPHKAHKNAPSEEGAFLFVCKSQSNTRRG